MTTLRDHIAPSRDGEFQAVRALTKSDLLDLADGPCRALVVAAAGTVNVTDMTGTNVDGVPLAAGIPLPLAIKRLRLGGTASNVFGLY